MNKNQFVEELTRLNIKIDHHQLTQLETYYELLIATNAKYNLTSITEHDQVYLKHFYDSLTITKAITLTNQSVCDIGTGAGFPGLVLKILYPQIQLTLIEATAKKCQFLKLIVDTLHLTNVTILNVRAEEYSKTHRELYDIVTCRAVAPLKHLLEYGIPLVKKQGYFIPLKGSLNEELNNIQIYLTKLHITIQHKYEFQLPYELSHRTILLIQKLSSTPHCYPRKYTDIKKKDIS